MGGGERGERTYVLPIYKYVYSLSIPPPIQYPRFQGHGELLHIPIMTIGSSWLE
jgi:hypothetical protein